MYLTSVSTIFVPSRKQVDWWLGRLAFAYNLNASTWSVGYRKILLILNLIAYNSPPPQKTLWLNKGSCLVVRIAFCRTPLASLLRSCSPNSFAKSFLQIFSPNRFTDYLSESLLQIPSPTLFSESLLRILLQIPSLTPFSESLLQIASPNLFSDTLLRIPPLNLFRLPSLNRFFKSLLPHFCLSPLACRSPLASHRLTVFWDNHHGFGMQFSTTHQFLFLHICFSHSRNCSIVWCVFNTCSWIFQTCLAVCLLFVSDVSQAIGNHMKTYGNTHKDMYGFSSWAIGDP